MKKICFLLLIVFCLAACGGGGDDSKNSNTRELALDETATDKLDEVGEVHMYHFHADADDSGRTLSVNLSGTHKNSPVDFMLTVNEEDDEGNLAIIFGESAAEEVVAEADINIDIPITRARDLYLAVRDFKDDEASDLVSYRLTATYSDEIEENDTMEDAIELQVGADNCYEEEAIFPESDEDYFRFIINGDNPAGVYRITAQYDVLDTTPMPVTLDLELFDGDGQLIQQYKGQKPADNLYVLLPYLDEGLYFLVVADQGRNNESQHHYSICIEPMNASEVLENDASDAPNVNIDGLFEGDDNEKSATLTGSLEYIQDEDWYEFEVAPAAAGEFKIIQINFFHDFGGPVPDELQNQAEAAAYRISVLNSAKETVHVYDQSVIATEPNNVAIDGSVGTNYIMVKPIYKDQMLMAMPYRFTLELKGVSDPGEANDPMTLNLTPTQTVIGKIYKVGDKDTYIADVVNTDFPKILEVDLTTHSTSEVTYSVTIEYDGKTRMLRDKNGPGPDGGIHCKTSFYLPTVPQGTEHRYVNLIVSDDQNNDGDNVDYHMTVNLLGIPQTVEGGYDYFSEMREKNAADSDMTDILVVEYANNSQRIHQANTTLLSVRSLDGNNQWPSPWITGFADYDGDRDLFELNFDAITEIEGAPEDWYFDIQIQMIADGSPVEYSWTLFRDANPNDVLVERTFWLNPDDEGGDLEFDPNGEGIVASWADLDTASNNIDMTVPREDVEGEEFWLGHRWRDNTDSKFYFSINDFNRANLSVGTGGDGESQVPVPNQIPDNDWGNTTSSPQVNPYRFQVTVTFHPDCSSPDEGACAP